MKIVSVKARMRPELRFEQIEDQVVGERMERE